MTKEQALHAFWSSFGLKAWEQSTVPTGSDAPAFPYLTYEVVTGNIDAGQIMLTASLWYRSESWVGVNAKTREIASRLSGCGEVIRFDDGAIWIKQGVPFAQSMADPDDNMIRRKLLNTVCEYISQD